MKLLEILCYFFGTAINYGTYLILLCIAFRSTLRFSKKKSLLIITSGYCIGFAFHILLLVSDAPLFRYHIVGTAILVILDIAAAVLLFKKAPLKIFLGVFIILNTQNNMMAIATQLQGLELFPLFLPEFPDLNYMVYLQGSLFLLLPLLYYLFCKLFRQLVEIEMDIALWRVLCYLPLVYYVYSTATGVSGAMTEPASWTLLGATVLRTLFAVVSYIGVIKLLLYAYEKADAHYRVEIAEQQVVMVQERYEALAAHIWETDRLLHDLRHHMISFRDFAERGDLAGLNEYLDRLGEAYQTREMPPICARPTVDVILRHYLGRAMDAGVEVTHHVEIPADFARSDLDLCVVFGNLTENAMEACLRQTEGKKYIHVTTNCIGGKMLAIRMENSFSGTISLRGGAYQSSKRNGSGLGLASIKNIAEQKEGTFHVSAEAGVFVAEILLNT